ncbi:PIG-L family deacetylase [Ramlibacter sp. WS9]|uniref:PIG-L family deacetylase n=1 Tax=Ramlibacter sp. WS9 TaxID=1882741 RepID=UPI001142DA41|nr:PIG-L family deacetylase [Ramlibacter sp. WS9]ROZ69403.1 PIG-L family deacetylase [Ramlibacter sp. WS9]
MIRKHLIAVFLMCLWGVAVAAPNCPVGTTMNVVAHQDDDLFFMNPDLIHEIRAGRCVRTVYVTAGDAGQPEAYWKSREDGAKAAYLQMNQPPSGPPLLPSWNVSSAGVPGRVIDVHSLLNTKVSLVFLRLPDGARWGGGNASQGYKSLHKLWTGTGTDVWRTAEPGTGFIWDMKSVDNLNIYTLAQLQDVLLTLVNNYQPDRLKTLDHVGPHADMDHPDHHTVAYIMDNVNGRYTTPHVFMGYRGYTVTYPVHLAENVHGSDRTDKLKAMQAYLPYDSQLPANALDPSNVDSEYKWVTRQYKVNAGPNLAFTATATASSTAGTSQAASKAIDGVAQGYPYDATREWAATSGAGAGSWLQLTWPSPQIIDRVTLIDRPNEYDQIMSGALVLSGGGVAASSESVGVVENLDGRRTVVEFAKRPATTVRLNIQTVSAATQSVGLSEIKVHGPPQFGTNHALTATVTASSQSTSTSQSAAKAIDDVVGGYPGDSSKEWATVGGQAGSWLRLAWSTARKVNQVILHDRVNTYDQVMSGKLTFSDGTSVDVGNLNDDGSPTPVVFPERLVSWVKFEILAVKNANQSSTGLAEIRVFGP